MTTAPDPAWIPTAAHRARSRLLAAVERYSYADLHDLHRSSVADPECWWREAVSDLGVEFSTPFDRVLDESAGKPFPHWFPGGRLNVAQLAAGRHAHGPLAGKDAVVYEGDAGQRRSLTYAELDAEVRRFAANLAARGIGAGDRVVLYMPVVPEASVAFLAIVRQGAIVVPAFTGYGADALGTRLREAGAVALVTADATTRRGRRVPLKETADAALEAAADVEQVIVVRHLGDGAPMRSGRDIWWDELPVHPSPVEPADTASNDPLCIVYTSGTTGLPKGIVHSHAGFAVKTAVDFAYGFDVTADDVVSWIADLGWLIGPMLVVGPLQLGATVVFTEGVPTHPRPTRMWEIVERHGVTVQGVAPTAARAILAEGGEPSTELATLRAFVSTGEAWDEPTWRWLFGTAGGAERPIINFSGGTEVGGGLLISYPFLPMGAATFTAALPGVDAAVFDPDGRAVAGEVGELVVRNTFPGMTHAFWCDRARYLDTYWQRWPRTWQHGDLASVDDRGTWRVHGRSDDTIKVSGRRVGPAELEAALLLDPRIAEAAAIGVPDPPPRSAGGGVRRPARRRGRPRRRGRHRRGECRPVVRPAPARRGRAPQDHQRQDHAARHPRALPGNAARRPLLAGRRDVPRRHPHAGGGRIVSVTDGGDLELIRTTVRELARKYDWEYWRRKDKDHEYPWEFVTAFADGGWLGAMIPEQYGGLGLGLTEAAVMMQEIAGSGAGMSGGSAIHFYVFPPAPIVRHGSEEMKKTWLPKIASGELLMAFGVTEPTAGVDTSRITTKAVRADGGWVINGQKVWITNAQNAHKILLLARTSPRSEDKPLYGMTLFLADMDRSHVTVREIDKLGRAAIDSNELFIDDLEVTDDDVVGEVDKGFYYLVDGLNPERTVVGLEGIGLGRAALELASGYAKDRRVFDRPIGQNQAVAHPLADSWVRLQAAEMVAMNAARLFDDNKPCGPESAAAKFLGAEAGYQACDRALSTFGGYAYAKEYHVERLWREVRLLRNAPFSQEMVLNYISGQVLELPRAY